MPWNLKDEIIAQLVGVHKLWGQAHCADPAGGGPGLKAMLPLKQLISHDLDYIAEQGGLGIGTTCGNEHVWLTGGAGLPRLLFCRLSVAHWKPADTGRASVSG